MSAATTKIWDPTRVVVTSEDRKNAPSPPYKIETRGASGLRFPTSWKSKAPRPDPTNPHLTLITRTRKTHHKYPQYHNAIPTSLPILSTTIYRPFPGQTPPTTQYQHALCIQSTAMQTTSNSPINHTTSSTQSRDLVACRFSTHSTPYPPQPLRLLKTIIIPQTCFLSNNPGTPRTPTRAQPIGTTPCSLTPNIPV